MNLWRDYFLRSRRHIISIPKNGARFTLALDETVLTEEAGPNDRSCQIDHALDNTRSRLQLSGDANESQTASERSAPTIFRLSSISPG